MMISSHLLRLPAPALVRGYASHLVTPASLSGLRHLVYTTSAPSDTQSAAETESNQRETTNETPKSDKEEYESAKSRAWYLNGSTKKSSDLAASASRQPIFTPYNPNTTTDAPEVALPIPELPSNLPPMAKPLHSFLINNPLFTPHTIRFITTTETPATNSSVDPTIYGSSILGGRRRKGLRATIKGTDDESGIRVEGREFGAYWDWICLVEVKASGKGAVRRGEKAIREWLYRNPLGASPLPDDARMPKIRTTSPDSEWAIIEANETICVNVMTKEGRAHSLAALVPEEELEVESTETYGSQPLYGEYQSSYSSSPIMQQQRAFTTSARRLAGGTSSTSRPAKLPEPTVFNTKSQPSNKHVLPEETRQYIPQADRVGLPHSVVTPNAARRAKEEAFVGPSRPRMVYERRKEPRALPSMKSKWPLYTLFTVLGLSAWGAFLLHATNAERLSSSVLRQVTYQLRNNEEVRQILGDRIHYAPNWWGFGEPYISGTVNLMQGKVDLKFRIQGSKDQGTVYFTSVRPAEDAEFRIVRYKVISDSGEVIHMKA